MVSAMTAWTTSRRTGVVRRANQFVTGSRAVIDRGDTGSGERYGEERAESKIKGDGTADARSRCLHVKGGGTPRPGAAGGVFPSRWRSLVPARAVYAGLRWATRNHGHG
jgi:hypothetical protein